jgi:protein-S-isoprenylcysteine O-methyltransferase Ste14
MALVNELREQGDFLFKYRGILPVVLIIPALAIFMYNEWNDDALDSLWEERLGFIALAISLFGLGIRAHVVGHVAPSTSGRNTSIGQKAESLNSTGLYSVVRHPLYLGNFFMWLGPALLTNEPWFIAFFIVLFYLYYERIMYAEERFLQDKFGEEYMVWAAGRPAIMPRISGYIPSPNRFNWRKVLRQERSGLLATFLIFWLFEILGDIYKEGWGAFEWDFWSIAFGVALVVFLILKSMKGGDFLRDRE